MIDITTIPLHEPLPDIKSLNYENISLTDENKHLKNVVYVLIVGVLAFLIYRHYASAKEEK